MASSHSDGTPANTEVCASIHADNDSVTVFNIDLSQTDGLHNCKDVTTEGSSGNLNSNVLPSVSNDTINIHRSALLSGTDQQDVCIAPVCITMNDSLSTNNAMETPTVILTPISVNTPEYSDNSHSILNNLRVSNINRVIFAHININSIRNKCAMLADMVAGRVDILLISETKINETFPTAQFLIPGYTTPYRADRTINGGGILLYVREDIPSKIVYNQEILPNIECFFVEINLFKKKWLIGGTYNPSKDLISNHKSLEHVY